jgi:hypothetical protein
MKRNSYIFISLLLSVVLFTSCITEDEYDNSPEGNFEALWQTIDRQYCFLDYKKQEYGLDWNEIYSQYKQRISKGMNNEQLFEVLADMLNELRDGHVNLSSKLEYSQYREWFDSYPANFSDSIQRVYLGKDYAQSSGKSTLLKIIAGVEKSFDGEVVFSPGYSVGYLEQDPKLDPAKTVKEIVQEGVQEIVDMIAEYDRINEQFAEPDADFDKLIARQGELQELLDHADAWNLDNKLERAMDALRCPPEDWLCENLSGGEKRRVALCRLLPRSAA